MIYFGSIGHPDYARPDIIGEAVSIALLNSEWADDNTHTATAIDDKTIAGSKLKDSPSLIKRQVSFPGISHQVTAVELPID
jgi:hypothetical protein